MLLPQREEIQKLKIEISDDSKIEKLQVKYAEKEMDSGSPENSSEQLDRKFPATTTVTPSVTKNHTSVVEVIKENHDEPNNKDNSLLKVNEASHCYRKNFKVCIEMGKSTKRKSKNTKGERQRQQSMNFRPPSKPLDVEVESSVFDQPAKVRSRREPPAKPPDRGVALIEVNMREQMQREGRYKCFCSGDNPHRNHRTPVTIPFMCVVVVSLLKVW
jgi:hypothetical protein